jgi:uncharacterized protein (TIGR02246 family)
MRKTLPAFWLMVFVMTPLGMASAAPSSRDEMAIRNIISEEVAAWNAGDATVYSLHFAPEGSFTNIYGMEFNGHEAFEKRHMETFSTFFKGSTREETVRRIRFVAVNVAIVDVDAEVRGVGQMPLGLTIPRDGVLRTRLQQVFVKHGSEWWIEAYHNVDLKSSDGVRPTATDTPCQINSVADGPPN